MSRSRRELADLCCPTCGGAFQTEVWLVVDRAERPDLVHILLDGKLNVAACPHCGAEGGINHPVLFHDPAHEQVICALPLSVQGEDAARALVGELLQALVAAIPGEERRPYLSAVELVPEVDGLRAALVQQVLADDTAIEDRLLAAALQELLNTQGQTDFQRIIAEHRRLLLNERADHALAEILAGARRVRDRELQRRAREAQALLGRMRSILLVRRRALAALLDDLAPLTDAEASVLPELKLMLDAIDPQEVYAARIALSAPRQALLDDLVDRLVARAEAAHEAEALAFVHNLQSLPRR